MTSKELRIGNYVLTKSTCIEIMPLDLVGIHQCEQAKAKIDYWGIEINEEWLFKFGFKYQDRDVNNGKIERFYISPLFGKHREYYLEMQLISSTPFSSPFAWLTWDIGGGKNWIHLPEGHELRYVHQLQNLYYSLAGKELEIGELVSNETNE